jgi:hypothetical protein
MLAQSNGHVATDKVDGRTQLLVASRNNTTKAVAAAARGINVIDYPEYSLRSRTKNWHFDEPASLTAFREQEDTELRELVSAAQPAIVEQDADNPMFGLF